MEKRVNHSKLKKSIPGSKEGMDLEYESDDKKRVCLWTNNFTVYINDYIRNNKNSEYYYANFLCWSEDENKQRTGYFYLKGIDNVKKWLNYKEDKMVSRPE